MSRRTRAQARACVKASDARKGHLLRAATFRPPFPYLPRHVVAPMYADPRQLPRPAIDHANQQFWHVGDVLPGATLHNIEDFDTDEVELISDADVCALLKIDSTALWAGVRAGSIAPPVCAFPLRWDRLLVEVHA